MSLNKQTHTPSVLVDGPATTGEFLIVTENISDCIGNVVTNPIAIFVPGDTSHTYRSDNFPANRLAQIQDRFEENAHLLPDLLRGSDRLSAPHRFSNGSCAFLVPMVHDGTLEAVLCLYDSGKREQTLHHQHLISLEPICRLAAILIAHARQSETESRMLQDRPAGSPAGNPQTAQLISSLLRTVSHDIRTPITIFRGFTKMMLDGRTGPISDSQRECLRMALNGVDQLVGVAESVSGVSGLIEQIRAEVLDFQDLWQTAKKSAQPLMAAKSVTLEEDIELESGTICGDRRALSNVVDRLLACVVRNADYRGRLRVEVRCRNEMTLRIELPGAVSIQEVERDLAGVREIVYLHGGQINLLPGKDDGQTLTLTLPGRVR